MIQYIKGNILETQAMALVNTVNLNGVMGKGIALQFKNAFPDNYKRYRDACKNKDIDIGKLYVTKANTIYGEKYIINFPTKTDWRKPSEYSYISAGLSNLKNIINQYNITSIAIPPLGSGNGGLDWEKVKKMIEHELSDINIVIEIYEPTKHIDKKMKSEKVKLTEARALLLYMLFDLTSQGEFVSEFSCEKICYFLQRFGASEYFRLIYEPKYYGPYSGKVKYVLYALNGSYLMGYSDMNNRPFEPIFLDFSAKDDIVMMIESNDKLFSIAKKTTNFLDGWYSDFALELLSSVDYIIHTYKTTKINDVIRYLSAWSERKSKMFNDKSFVTLAINHICNNI